MSKRAVVLGGGGARGPYQIGVWKALRELNLEYHIVTGTSVGSLNGALMVQGNYREAVCLWEKISFRDIAALSNVSEKEDVREDLRLGLRQAAVQGGLDVSPLEELVREAVSADRFFASPVDFGLVTVRLPGFSPVQLTKAEIPPEKLIDYLMASASYYPLFQPRVIDGKSHIDGAYSDNMPANLALRCGAEELVVVDIAGMGFVHRLSREVPVTYIRSRWFLGQIMEFDTASVGQKMALGYLDCLKAYRKLEGSSYAFYPGESRLNALVMRDRFQRIRQRCGISILRHYWRLPQRQEAARYHDRRFYRHGKAKYTIGHAITSVAEMAGEIMGVPPWELYTFDAFHAKLLQGGDNRTAAGRRSHPIADGQTAVLAPLSQSGAHMVTKRLYSMLRHAWNTGRAPEVMWGLAAVSPREFLAAYYLLALTLDR